MLTFLLFFSRISISWPMYVLDWSSLISLHASPIFSLSLFLLLEIFPQYSLIFLLYIEVLLLCFYFSRVLSYILNIPLFIVLCSCFMDLVFLIFRMIAIIKYRFWSWARNAKWQNEFAKEHRNASMLCGLVLIAGHDIYPKHLSSWLTPGRYFCLTS